MRPFFLYSNIPASARQDYARSKYLWTSVSQQIRILCDDDIGNVVERQERHLSIGFVWSNNVLYPFSFEYLKKGCDVIQ